MGSEIWVPITDFEHYEVSNHGRIRNRRGTILTYTLRPNRAARVSLFQDGVRHDLSVNVVVAREFLRGFREYSVVSYKDNDPSNNDVSNLYMSANVDNIQLGTSGPRWGGRVRNVTHSLVFANAYEAAEYIRGDPSCIYKILQGERKTHKGCIFEIVEPDYGY